MRFSVLFKTAFFLAIVLPVFAAARDLPQGVASAAHLAELKPASGSAAPEHWSVYYGQMATPEELQNYDLLVLDPETHPPLRPLLNRNHTVLAYLSLGEAKIDHQADRLMTDRSMVLSKNPNWQSLVIDIRNPAWMAMVVEQLVPSLLQQGFDGVMLDTIDSSIALEMKDKKAYAGMQKAAAQLVHTLRENYPDMKIMVNRGFEILPQVAGDIDMVLAESIFTTYDFKTNKHLRVQPSHYESIVNYLQKLKEVNPRLMLFSLDYWPLEDVDNVRRIYAEQRAHGLVPYVSTLDLQSVTAEP